LQDHGLPFVVASIRDVATYPRVRQALQRARYSDRLAQLGRLAVDERNIPTLVGHACRLAVDALEVESALVCLLADGGREFAIAGGHGALAGQVGRRIPNEPARIPRMAKVPNEPRPVMQRPVGQCPQPLGPGHRLNERARLGQRQRASEAGESPCTCTKLQ